MNYAVLNKAIVTIYECPAYTMQSKEGQTLSSIADQGLYGMLIAITGEEENGFYPVRTFYGYTGYLSVEDADLLSQKEAESWEADNLHVVSGFCVDVMSLPKVQGVCLISLFRGALLAVEEWDLEDSGWAMIRLADGQQGYIRNQFLTEKKFSQKGVFTGVPVQRTIEDEEQFRLDVTETAKKYLGVQYRWGGRSSAGIDCSGLTSESYLLNGILTFRDAKIKEGFPVHEISRADIKPGDLLYFPGHIGMYLGDGDYIHSTGRTGSGGVVINSLNPESPVFRQDLLDSLYAVGSIF
ncbi:MAG: C40 family peptidase [Lachnospiraceae bacterium]|nr:C40 family peptidase [Lachnospiraceae bacterium]